MKTFLKSSDIQLKNGGYLLNKEEKPVYNQAFVEQQQMAEKLILTVELAKGRNFKESKVDTLAQLAKDVEASLSAKEKEFVKAPTAPKLKVIDGLKNEALAFISFSKESDKTNAINTYLQNYLTISEFEEFGLFFEEDIVKLTKIYTIAEITEAAKAYLALAD